MRALVKARYGVAAVVGILLVVLTGSSVLADHGSWTHHHLHYGESGSSQYWSYGDVDASDDYDYGHVTWFQFDRNWNFITSEQVTCNGSEQCGYRKTYTRYFSQSPGYNIKTAACAKDDDHKLSGSGSYYFPCSPQGLYVHEHSVYLT